MVARGMFSGFRVESDIIVHVAKLSQGHPLMSPSQRGLLPSENATREDLLERVKANLRIPRKSNPAS